MNHEQPYNHGSTINQCRDAPVAPVSDLARPRRAGCVFAAATAASTASVGSAGADVAAPAATGASATGAAAAEADAALLAAGSDTLSPPIDAAPVSVQDPAAPPVVPQAPSGDAVPNPQAHQQPPPEQPPEYQPVRQEEAVTPEPVTAVREDIHDPVERMKENKQRLIAYYKEVEPSRADDVENINKILIEYSLPELTDALENKYGKAPVFVLRPGE